MLQQIPFIKMQALGNDFIIIHHKYKKYFLENNKEKIKLIANRVTGITVATADFINKQAPNFAKAQVGADQIIFYDIINEQEKIISLSIFNQDSSEACACGNGFRCIGKYFWEEKSWQNLTLQVAKNKQTYNVQRITDSQIKLNSKADEYIVNMGFLSPEPYNSKLYLNILNTLEKHKINPTLLKKITKYQSLIRYVYAPNPHLVFFVDELLTNKEIIECGKILEPANINNKLEGQNINFVKVLDENNIQVNTYERGTGLTKACGTGAVASFCASFTNYMASASSKEQHTQEDILNSNQYTNYPLAINSSVTVHMNGGKLRILNQSANNNYNIFMQGLATIVFKGSIKI